MLTRNTTEGSFFILKNRNEHDCRADFYSKSCLPREHDKQQDS